MRKEDIDYVSSATKHSVSFLVALGYEVEQTRECKDRMEDAFLIYLDGMHIPYYDKKRKCNTPYLNRRNFYKFASSRHKALRLFKKERRIGGYID